MLLQAIGFELGRPLKASESAGVVRKLSCGCGLRETKFCIVVVQVINCAQLISRESSTKTGSNISTAFKDARLMDAVLVLEDFQVSILSAHQIVAVKKSMCHSGLPT